ncbi:LLM class flavin-dependent oxidoreductase [Lysinimonas soli]|uniref:LLM class flavin-dependent oxidoreductase n=1 Tax=Lysinimonas soli TaxID=1074233 RepID=A0ABW0NMR4_9MICO
MPDYGHDLRFGTFITPGNNPPDAPVALAQLSEQLGFDLVTFQDHPYQPAFLDTWTLLSWVAAETSTIHVSGNVLNAQLRRPAVLARAAASLDLLSGGRFDLGLGAGGFADAVASMGQPKLTPGQALEALEESITIIRGIWDADDRSVFRVDGQYHRVDGAKRGPAPAHDIPIWIGALKPRMLRLVGRAADGWLPSYAYLQPGELQAGNAAIDAAATKAGRDPREIRRLLNIGGAFATERRGFLQGPPSSWVEDLLPLVVDDGESTFILASDDPGVLQNFALEVIPLLRDAVEEARAAAETAGTDIAGTGAGGAPRIRSAAARAKRRDGIEYDALPLNLQEAAIEPGDARYSRVRNTYMRGGSPGLVLQLGSAGQLAEALAFARTQQAQNGVPLGLRSGGHGISGRSTNDGGIILDVSKLNGIEILDETTRRVRVGAGARWVDVAAALAPHGWALTSGDYGGVGVGGLATAGGIGWFSRGQGLTIDHLRRVELVTVDGREVAASAEENPELFWGMRGAGANFGVATAFEFEVHDGGDVGFAQLAFDASGGAGGTAGFLERFGAVIEAAPRDLVATVFLGGRRSGQPQVAQVMAVVHSDDPDVVIDRLQPLAEIAPLVQQSVQLMPYAQVMANAQPGDQHGQGEPFSRSGLVDHLSADVGALSAELLDRGLSYFFTIRSVGGAVADVPQDATAYSTRSANFNVVALGSERSGLNEYWDERMKPLMDGLYLSFETSLSPDRFADTWKPDALARLRALKKVWDPKGVLRDNFGLV